MPEQKQNIVKRTLEEIGNNVQALREGPVGRGVDRIIELADNFLGPSGKAWLANGLDELRQAVALGNEQIQAGPNPGLWGTITTGEATAERMAGDQDKEKILQTTYDVPQQKLSLDDLRAYANDRANEAQRRMEHQNDQSHGM